MSSKDLHNRVFATRAISATRVTDNTAQVSQIIDTQGFEALEFLTSIGTIADADATFTVLVEDGDDAALADAAAVADDFLLGTEAQAGFQFDDDDQVRRLGYVGKKRYVRYTITPANNTGNADFSVVALLGRPRHAPTDANT